MIGDGSGTPRTVPNRTNRHTPFLKQTMKNREFIIYILVFVILGTLMCVYIARGSKQEAPAYPTEINRLVIGLGKNWDSIKDKKEQLIPSEEPFEYAVLDMEGNLLQYTKAGIATSVSSATTQFDVIRDIEQDGAIVGRLLVHNPYLELQSKRDLRQALMIGALSDTYGVRGFEIGFSILGGGYLLGAAAIATSFLFTFKKDRIQE